MRVVLACLYDLHGNLLAPDAVLEDARAAGATRGNADRRLVDPPEDDTIRAAVGACRTALGPGGVNALATLPERAQVADWMGVHASPVSDLQGFAREVAAQIRALGAGAAWTEVPAGHLERAAF